MGVINRLQQSHSADNKRQMMDDRQADVGRQHIYGS